MMKSLVPGFIVQKFMDKAYHGKLSATAMIIDISGFTPLTENLAKHGNEGIEVLSRLINRVFTPCINTVYRNNGFIATFIGDAVLAIFDSNSRDALFSADKIMQAFLKNRTHRTKFGDFEICCKIGLSFGDIEWGIIGKGDDKSYYFRGKAVEACHISEKHCRSMDIVVDDSLYNDFSVYSDLANCADGFHRILSVRPPGKICCKNNTEKNKKSSYTLFIPGILRENIPVNELREVVSIFISFRDTGMGHADMDALFSAVSGICEKWGGFYRRINFDDKGCNILINFGIPVSFEKNILRAINCIHELRAIYGNGLKAGITAGILFAGFIGSRLRAAYDVLGDAVNLSARIAVSSDWGAVQASQDIKNKAESFFKFSYMNKYKYKGKSEAIKTYSLGDRISPGTGKSHKGRLYGRDLEIAFIKKAVNKTIKGKFGGIIYIYGDAGIGKSRLIDEVSEYCRDSALVCNLPCDNMVRKSWNPFLQYLNTYFEQNQNLAQHQNQAVFTRIHKNLADEAGLRPGSRETVDELIRTESFLRALLSLDITGMLYEKLDARGKFENTLYAVKEFFKALSLISPVIIHLEDLHWIDDHSKTAIEHLIHNIENFPIIILASSRFNDDGSKPVFNADSRTECSEIVLKGLQDQSVKSIIKEITGCCPDKDMLNFIRERTFNNPFYIEQFILFLDSYGFIARNGSSCSVSIKTGEIPSEIKQIIIARIDRLTREVKELTRIASVIGREFDSSVLFRSLESLLKIKKKLKTSQINTFDMAVLAKIMKKDRYSYLVQGQAEKIWTTPDDLNYVFLHSILRESAYDMQLRERLRIIHQIVAETTEKIIAGTNDNKSCYLDLAYHFEKANNHEKTREYLEKAGKYLQETYNNDRAIEVFTRLLKYTRDHRTLIDIYNHLGDIYELTGKMDLAEKSYRESLALSRQNRDPSGKAVSMTNLANILISRGEFYKAKRLNQKALNIALKTDDKVLLIDLYSQIAGLYYLECRYAEALEYCTKSLEIAQILKNKFLICRTLGNMGNIYMYIGDTAKAKIYFRKSLRMAKEMGNLERINRAVYNMGLIYKHSHEYEKAKIYFHEGLEITIKTGNKRELASFFGALGNIFRSEEDYSKATRFLEKQLEIYKEIGDRSNISTAYESLGVTFYYQARYEKAMASFQKMLECAEEINSKKDIATAYNHIGALHAINCDFDNALNYYKISETVSEESGNRLLLSNAMANKADLYNDMGKLEDAIDYYDKAIDILMTTDHLYEKYFYCFHKARILYDNACYTKAEALNTEVLTASKKLNFPDIAFLSKILEQKIIFMLSHSDSSKNKCIGLLENLLKPQLKDDTIATVAYELFLLTKDDKYRQMAMGIFEKLYRIYPRYNYKKAMDRLKY